LSCEVEAAERTSCGYYLSQLWPANAAALEKEEGEGIKGMSKLTAGKKRFVKRTLSEERPTILVGKGGVSEQVVKEVQKQLEKRGMVKIKFLGTALKGGEAKQVANEIAERVEASLVEVRGHTIMLFKRRKK
jgi:RNA-binding protein